MLYKHNKNSENVIGHIVWAVGSNGQNELFGPLKIHVNIKWGWAGVNIDQFKSNCYRSYF